MNTEQQRIKIAEACGWTDTPIVDGKYGQTDVPDYLNDLNAMHEAVKSLSQIIKPRYFSRLCFIVYGAISLRGYIEATEATAAQRAEAFLRTLGKWEETP